MVEHWFRIVTNLLFCLVKDEDSSGFEATQAQYLIQ